MTRTKVSLLGEFCPKIVRSSILLEGDTVVVQLWGEHDASSVPSLAITLASAVALHESNVVVDLSRVSFVNAATIRVLAAAGDFLTGQSRTFTYRSPSPCARRMLDLCGVSDLVGPEGT